MMLSVCLSDVEQGILDVYMERFAQELTYEEEEKMMQNLKLLLLKNNSYVVAQVEEIVADYGMPNCKLIQPYEVMSEVDLRPWPCYTDQEEVLFSSDNILTIISPNADVVKAYIDMVPSVIDEEVDEVLQRTLSKLVTRFLSVPMRMAQTCNTGRTLSPPFLFLQTKK